MDLSLFERPQNMIALLTALFCFATVMTLAAGLMHTDKLESRLKSVANRREELRRRSRQQIKDGGLRHSDEGFAKMIVEKLQLRRLLEDTSVVDKLAQAGFRGPQPVSTFYLFRFVSPFALAVPAFVYLFLLHQTHLVLMQKVVVIFGGLLAGYYAPNMYIKNAAAKRQGSIMQVFPDALDLLLICVEAGMSIEAAIQKVAHEVGSSSMELAEELSLLTAELSYLPDRRMAYEGLARRTNNPGIKAVTTAMIQAERYGTPLGTALRVMAKENRDLRLAAAEKKAGQLPAKLTVPMIVFFLPALFIVIMGPAIIKVQDSMKPGAHAKK